MRSPGDATPPAFSRAGWPLVLSAGGGVLTNLAFPDRGWWPLAYLGVALLLLALRRARVAQAGVTGLVWGVAFFLPHVYWVVHATGSLVPWIALSMMQALYIAGFAAAWTAARRAAWMGTRPVVQAALAAVIWVAVEQLRASWPFGGFPWGILAFSQTDAPLVRLAPYGGEVLVSAVVVFIGALMTWAWVGRSRVLVAAGAAGAGLVVALGPWLLPLDDQAEVGALRVGAVQGNVPQLGAEWAVQAREVTANHTRGTRRLGEDVGDRLDLVLWPESAADIDPRTDAAQAALVDAAARAAGAPVLLGTQRFPAGQDVRYNELVLWQEGGTVGGVYAKQHPVPFGEYMPYRDLFRRITPLVDRVSTDMAAGQSPGIMPIPVERLSREVDAAVGICFEVAYAGLIREGVVGGGELIIIPTNNASFGYSQESTQQLAMSRFRAVEHGRATVQVSTVGVSGIILPDGRVVERTELFTAQEMVAPLPLRTSLTPAARLGTVPTLAVWVLAAVGVTAGVLSRRGRTGGPAGQRTETVTEGHTQEELTAQVSLVTGQ